jgi:hypothetical protein
LPRRTVARFCRRPLRVACLLLFFAACEPQSDRPALSSLPAAATLDSSLLVGTWRCRDLNPYPGQASQVITTTYGQDGAYVSESEIAGRGPVGAIAVVQRGRWSVDANQLLTHDVVTDARALDGNTETDALAKASAELIDAMGEGRPAASEVLRLDTRRLTLRPADVTDPPVIGCIRQTGAGPLVTGGDAT